MKAFFMVALLVAATTVQAANYVCNASDPKQSLRARVNMRGDETAVFVLSNPKFQEGNKTIATFDKALVFDDSDDGVTDVYVSARVDFRTDVRKGELIGGTKLGELNKITLAIESNEEDESLTGTLTLTKRKKGEKKIAIDMLCEVAKSKE